MMINYWTYQSPSVIIKTVIVADHIPTTLTTTLQTIVDFLDFERLVSLITFWQLIELHKRLRRFAAMSCIAPVLRSHSLSFYIHLAEDAVLGLVASDELVEFFVVHVASLFVLFFLIGFQNRSLKKIDVSQYHEISTVGKQSHQELFLFFLRRLVVKTTSLNDFVVDVELVTCPLVHGFFHALFCDEPQN
jgi:hypothetical protein